jgi:hypothetical protein
MRTSVVWVVVLGVVLSFGGRAMAEKPKPIAAPARGLFSAERVQPLVQQALDSERTRRQPLAAAGGSRQRDSIWNGGLIGAAIGGVGGSALIVASRGGSDDIGRAMLNVCVPPALAGFAVGAIVDALH